MGMASMFGSGADLSGLLKSSVPLFVGDVIHKATIELNEELASLVTLYDSLCMNL